MVKVSNYIPRGTFSSKDAAEKQIVAMVDGTNAIKGAGIVKQTSSGYVLTIEKKENEGTPQEKTVQENFTFDAAGKAVSNNAINEGYTLQMADTNVEPISDAIANNAGVVYKREVDPETGVVSYVAQSTTENIDIDNLNARDQFAIQILRSLLDKTKDPSGLNSTEVAYYCETAYTWAGYMMKESSHARAVIKDSNPTTNIQEVPVGYLADNTEKLLNNIAAALDKTNAKITVGQEVDLEAERITIPELNKLIGDLKTLQENYVKDGNNTVGLKDLITAIGNINFTNLISAITNMSTVRTANIGSNGLGNSANNPIYISRAGSSSAPEKSDLSRVGLGYADYFYVFDSAGDPGWSTFSDIKDAILSGIQTTIDNRIRAWLTASGVTPVSPD